jgi:hypothetical protein
MAMGEESSSYSSYSSSSSNNASAIDSSNIVFQVRLALISLCFPFCPFRAHIISFSFCIYLCNLNYVEYCSCSWAMNIVGLFAATKEERLERRYRSWCFRAGSFILPLFFIVNF